MKYIDEQFFFFIIIFFSFLGQHEREKPRRVPQLVVTT